MSISDAAGEQPQKPRRSRKGQKQHRLSDQEWKRVRVHYETDRNRIALRALADQYGIPHSTIMLRAAAEHWKRKDQLALTTERELEQSATKAVRDLVPGIVNEITKRTLDDLQPWIEKQKRVHIRSQVNRGKRALTRIDKLIKTEDSFEPKDESFIAKAVDTYDNVVRRNLGMSDSKSVGGSLSLAILTGQAAVQINQTQVNGAAA